MCYYIDYIIFNIRLGNYFNLYFLIIYAYHNYNYYIILL